jgi:hypothetical protein
MINAPTTPAIQAAKPFNIFTPLYRFYAFFGSVVDLTGRFDWLPGNRGFQQPLGTDTGEKQTNTARNFA